MPVHLYGHPADMQEINEIAKKHNLFVIEDCAQSIGAEYNGKKVGSFGSLSIFSFYATKLMTTEGHGGMVLTNSSSLIEELRDLTKYDKRGIEPEYKIR